MKKNSVIFSIALSSVPLVLAGWMHLRSEQSPSASQEAREKGEAPPSLKTRFSGSPLTVIQITPKPFAKTTTSQKNEAHSSKLEGVLTELSQLTRSGLTDNPNQMKKELQSAAQSLSPEELQELGLKSSDAETPIGLRNLSAYLLSLSHKAGAIHAIESGLENLRFREQGESRPDEVIAILLLNALAAQPDTSAVLASFGRLERKEVPPSIRHYLDQQKRAIEAGKLTAFYQRQDEKLRRLIASD